MSYDFSGAEAIIQAALGRVFPAAQVVVRRDGAMLWSAAYGWLDPEAQTQPATPDTLFDLASVTKLFVVTAFMTLVEEGRVGLDQPVATVLPEFTGERPILPYDDPLKPGAHVAVTWDPSVAPGVTAVDAARVAFRHLLTHTSGLPAWRPLYKAGSPEAARQAALTTFFSYPIAARIVYSDIGLILVGLAIERLTGQPLDTAVAQRVTGPLGLLATRYVRIGEPAKLRSNESVNPETPLAHSPCAMRTFAPTEFCAWRNRRIVGEVHDENAAGLAGVAGHAGLFSTATDLAIFGETFLVNNVERSTFNVERSTLNMERSTLSAPRPAILRPDTIAEMTRVQAQDAATRRGIGFALWSADPEASSNPLSERAFGHTGFTGTSLWMDPARDLTVAVCTNRVYYGRDATGILAFRVALHRAIVAALEAP